MDLTKRELEAACRAAGVSVIKIGKVWGIAKIDGMSMRPGTGIYQSAQDALIGGLVLRGGGKVPSAKRRMR